MTNHTIILFKLITMKIIVKRGLESNRFLFGRYRVFIQDPFSAKIGATPNLPLSMSSKAYKVERVGRPTAGGITPPGEHGGSIGEFADRPPFRDVGMGTLGFIPGLGDIQITITTAELLHIRDSVNTGADNVLIDFPVPGGQPARAAHITVSLLIEEQAFEQFIDPVPVFVKIIAFGLLNFF